MAHLNYILCDLLIVLLGSCYFVTTAETDEVARAREFLADYEARAADIGYRASIKAWIYNTNITDYNSEQMVAMDLLYTNFTKEAAKDASMFNFTTFPDTLRREFASIADLGTSAMKDPENIKRLSVTLSKMEGIYSKGKVCGVPPNYDCMTLEPGVTRIMADDRDYDKLALVWKRWHDVSKGEMKQLYEEFVSLSNQGIKDGGRYNDTGSYWRSLYESDTFEEDLQNLLDELKPLYDSLHAYVRRKLKQTYPNHTFPASGHIPAHLFGNMWAQSWINLNDIVEPFPGKKSIDITPVLKERNYTALMMFKTAEEFFTSLGLRAMSPEFWENSMIERPTDGRDVVCHASAWDFSHGNDTRIKMCTDITMDDLVTIHHEMGHIQYYLQYQNQPLVFQSGANPGFHEAIGDVMALSASTPKHLKAIGLLDEIEEDYEADINFLMLQALDKVAFLPFGYLIDQWRWSVFRGDTPPEQYNDEWWRLRCKYQGISPPVARSADDFDAGAKYHIPANTPYIRYFVSYVIQFQLHKALCEAANQTGPGRPLYQCDIYNSMEAGEKLGNLLQKGSSEPWEDLLEEVTGSRKMNASALKEYFAPLIEYLNNQTEGAGEETGWTRDQCPDIQDDIEGPMADQWLEQYNTLDSDVMYKTTIAQWNYGSNLTDYNNKVMVNRTLEKSDFDKKMAQQANYFPWQTLTNGTARRQFGKITNIGTNALKDKNQLKEMTVLQSKIEGIYGKGQVVMSDGRTLKLEPGLTEILTSSRNYTELTEAWQKWRDVTGPLMKEDYAEFVQLSNKAVNELDYNDTGEYWRNVYEAETFQEDLENLLKELSPLYELLHAYVRKELIKTYGAENFPSSGHIPAHLLGNMWGQHWNNIYDIVVPYRGEESIDVTGAMIKQVLKVTATQRESLYVFYLIVKPGNMWGQQWNNIYDLIVPYKGAESIDVTAAMIEQGYTVPHMFRTAEEFFKSLGLLEMPEEFWNKTIMVNPEGITMVCHASAWDFYNQKDFRIKMCTEVNMEELIVIHHEMGHIQYFLQYKDQPVIFRDGANPGFHEAIGDVMALSVSTPTHLHKIGLLDAVESSHENDINFLMKMALEKIAFLPFGYLIDQWRWSVFSGETPPSAYNDKWWELRCKYQGLSPAVERKATDFDPGAKYHIPANVPYIRYFVSFVVQFQFHKALCGAANFVGPLHKCDIYQSTAAGAKMREMLKLGSSKPWPEVIKQFAGTEKMQVAPLVEYFKPLQDWLENHVSEEERGWSDTECSHVTEGDEVKEWLKQYEIEASREIYESGEKEWAYYTNITDENEKQMNEASLKLAEYQQAVAKNVSKFHWRDYKDETLKRRLSGMADIGTSAMSDKQKLRRLKEVQTSMEGIYSKATVCMEPNKCKNLDPGLMEIMAESRDYDELLTAWRGWRDASGKKMPQLYEELVTLSNEAVKGLGYTDTGEYWRSSYESETFQTDLEDLLSQLKPLYENLHTYVRRELMNVYGSDKFPEAGHIPAHLLGNMWAQEWNNIYDIVVPFKNKTSVDITDELVKKGYNATTMFRIAEEFFTSLGLPPMRQEFWDKSMIVRPEGRDVVCHGSAWDFSNAKDFRIKMCTKPTMEDLITIHHEMGHIQYYMAYSGQPMEFRNGANPGFHEAIGDTMALSATTPKHLRKINLLADGSDDKESEINFLMKMALEKIAFLPFGYLIDQWRWSVFSGETPPSAYNDKWWELRCKYQGLSPPVTRSDSDFDPGAKYHIPGNVPYIRYFVSFVVQFQFHKALCQAAGDTGPLHRCDIYRSKEAGQKFQNMLSMGSSKPWPEVMELMTGQRKMDAGPLMEYFKPLIEWLENENKNERPGWSTACPSPRTPTPIRAGTTAKSNTDTSGRSSASPSSRVNTPFRAVTTPKSSRDTSGCSSRHHSYLYILLVSIVSVLISLYV